MTAVAPRVPGEDRREEIARVAVALFAERGFDGASMSELAERLSLSKAGIYHYFPTKESILYEALRDYAVRLVATVEAADDPMAAPEARLHAVVLALLELYRDADALHKVQVNDLARLPALEQEEIRARERKVVRRVQAIVAALAPQLTAPEVSAAAMSIFG
jgi:AcrR family transcriptional regulator